MKFINAYLTEEQTIRYQLNKQIKQFENSNQQKNEIKYKLLENQRDEKLNEEGIMEDSQLNLDIIDMKIENLRQNSPDVFVYLMITTDGNQVKTKPKKQDLNITFEEGFIFSQFQKQNIIRIKSQNGLIYEIFIMGLWVFSRVKYYSDILESWEPKIKQTSEQIKMLSADLKKIRQPFQSMWDQIQQEDPEFSGNILENPQNNNFEQGGHFSYSAIMITDVPMEEMTKYCFGIYTIFTILSMIYRPDFFNLTVAIFGSILSFDSTKHLHQHKDSQFYLKMFCLSIATILYDVVFLIQVTSVWTSYQNAQDGGVTLNLRRASLAMSYISLFFRIGIVYLFWRLYDKSKTNPHLRKIGGV
ncbi:UNKNOWN [Stylonychia lemnae]|uniref:C2 domain-containing protein n=1 Tax=Stylonychia lemnae TaxID=5949 RepID=A0A078AHF0_STYLE|nr:UNKNOWN [Stylonychia lemnae]|eukprot:CDW81271.1 UNKNOWN [Stylonychia lemnae]